MLEIIMEKIRVLILCGMGATIIMSVATVITLWWEHREGGKPRII